MITDKAEERILQGFKTWEMAEKQQSMTHYRAAIGLVKTGLKEITEPVPYLYGKLALLSYNAGIQAYQQKANDAGLLLKSAGIHANTALRDDPMDFDSNLVLTFLASDNISEKVTFNDVMAPADGIGGFLGKVIGTSVKAGHASASRAHFCNQVKNLVQAFTHATKEESDCQGFLDRCQRIGGIAEFCHELGLHKEEAMLYRAVVSVDLSTLTYDTVEVNDVPEYRKAATEVSVLAEALLAGI